MLEIVLYQKVEIFPPLFPISNCENAHSYPINSYSYQLVSNVPKIKQTKIEENREDMYMPNFANPSFPTMY